ncbi:outer membrane protein OmpA-like peptidoglycan-associated protein [Altererythrobacter atlanticus]|uniref:Outer membrane porin F n=2 Tax=Croceibacterium atlanticum TaxID=1267766 RepID=A0A0F7KPT0_9SPHN|nr:Outer membrane porin F precursor [Croceibacterium atlanticum]MBB5732627.1 outer membrane protein OmpA-like peptidoglycan-associated protein [Croceibacterium atlanticum]
MNIMSRRTALFLSAMLAVPATSVSAQELEPASNLRTAQNEESINVFGALPDDLTGLAAGPEVEGFISARRGREMQITTPAGEATKVLVSDATEIKAKGGFLGLGRTQLAADALLNGLPVTVETVEWEGGLIASKIRFKDDDLETAEMIRGGTAQRFAEHDVAIEKNAMATEALRGRMGDIDQYNLKGTTNVHFDTGKWALSRQAEADLCATANQAEAMDNALLLVVGYTDSVGDEEYNQVLSEKRAGRVVNFLQQRCGWKPYRMLTPTGMSEADPLASNDTEAGKAQNRRVSVNILVSKAVDEL